MPTAGREARLQEERTACQALKSASSVFDFEAHGEPPDRYTFIFRGRGLACRGGSAAQIVAVELHRVEIRLPPSYPTLPPSIRWLTPIFHPNVSSSGYVNLKAIELTWVRELGLEIVAERLWDMARLAYRNEGLASHFQARNWITRQSQFLLPVDPRPLRDLVPQSNVIRYERGGEVLVAAPPRKPGEDVLYIDEDTPAPDLPARSPPQETRERSEIWYLGDE